MAKLKNTFSWSFSSASDFEECRRKRYWSKYGMWGGWERNATEVQRKAYQLNKMDNRFSLQGNAVEETIMWVLRQAQAGQDVTADQAYEQVARPYLNRRWKESKDRQWAKSPKQYCCLREHYYGDGGGPADKEWTARVIEITRQCIAHFIERVLPRLAHVRVDQEVAISTQGDPESFAFEGTKVYAIPDYVYRADDQWHIHDWKSGRAKPEHKMQLALYGLWANVKHGVAPESIFIYLEYLQEGVMAYEQVTPGILDEARDYIRTSVIDMTDYLVDADTSRNEAVSKDEWELAADPRSCRFCNFYELCADELDAG